MRIETMRRIVDLSETLNFSETASRFYVTQPAFSRQIAAIETEIGFKLFDRHQHSVKLTKEGVAFVDGARDIISTYDSLIANIKSMVNESSTRLRIGYLIAASRPFLATASKQFENAHPEIKCEYVPMTARQISDALADDEIDVAITADVYIDTSLYAITPVYRDNYAFAMSRFNPLATKETISLEDLTNTQISLPDEAFNPIERKRLKRMFQEINYQETRSSKRGIEDIPFIISDDRTVIPLLSHLQFYRDPSVHFVKAADGMMEGGQIVLAWHTDSANRAIDMFAITVSEAMRDIRSLVS